MQDDAATQEQAKRAYEERLGDAQAQLEAVRRDLGKVQRVAAAKIQKLKHEKKVLAQARLCLLGTPLSPPRSGLHGCTCASRRQS